MSKLSEWSEWKSTQLNMSRYIAMHTHYQLRSGNRCIIPSGALKYGDREILLKFEVNTLTYRIRTLYEGRGIEYHYTNDSRRYVMKYVSIVGVPNPEKYLSAFIFSIKNINLNLCYYNLPELIIPASELKKLNDLQSDSQQKI